MKVIRPAKITPDMILTSSAPDNTEPSWLAEVSYAKGVQVVYRDRQYGPSVYQSAGDENQGNQPDISPDDWVRVGPTYRWAPFDGSASTVSETEGGYQCSFRVPTVFDALAFFEIYGAKVTITVRLDDATEVFRQERTLVDNSRVVDGYTYCFEPFDFIRDGVVKNIPPFSNAIVTIDIEGRGRTGIGEIIVGLMTETGCTEYGATHGIRDFSRVKEDTFGNRFMEQGSWAKKNNLQVMVEHGRHRYVSRILTELRGLPTVFIGSDNPQHEPLIVFGSLKDWQAAISYPTKTLFNIEIQGLI